MHPELKDPSTASRAVLERFPSLRILVVGDVMLDTYCWGTCTRVSPEAPVPVVLVERTSTALGGAANTANNLAHLGVQVELAGFVASDAEAESLEKECHANDVGCSALLRLPGFRTILKTRVMAGSQQILRVDQELATPSNCSDSDDLIAAIEKLIEQGIFSAIIVSDYAKGTITPYICEALMQRCHRLGIPLYADARGVDLHKFRGATGIKPSQSELMESAKTMGWPTDMFQAGSALRKFVDAEFVVLSLGAEGLAVITDGQVTRMPTMFQGVVDITGAGDTVFATLVAAISSGVPLGDAATMANMAASKVISQVGTVPIRQDQLLTSISECIVPTETRSQSQSMAVVEVMHAEVES